MKPNKNGLVIWESKMLVAIVTGVKRPSRNSKTGGLLQVFILYKHTLPSNAIVSGEDSFCCGDCKRRPLLAKEYGVKPCYVELWRGTNDVWRCWKRGGYKKWDGDPAIFSGKLVRFGAYGDPVLIPRDIVSDVVRMCKAHTGYTHQWEDPMFLSFRSVFKASVDTEEEYARAKKLGWSTFRVRGGDEPLLENEHVCPASKEAGSRKTCETCMLCNGHGWDETIVEHR